MKGWEGVSEPGGWAAVLLTVKAQLFPPPAAPTLSITFSGKIKKIHKVNKPTCFSLNFVNDV